MEDYKETRQEYDNEGGMKTHLNIERHSREPSHHGEIVNMTISIIMAMTALVFCSLILIGAVSVTLGMFRSGQEQVR